MSLSEEDKVVLNRFGSAYGRRWKAVLLSMWEKASYPGHEADAEALQRFRNTLGPDGLDKLRRSSLWPKPTSTVFVGELKIDHERGVIYFHDHKSGACVLRICNLPKPIPELVVDGLVEKTLDITHLIGQDWNGDVNIKPGAPSTLRLDYTLLVRPEGDHGNEQELLA